MWEARQRIQILVEDHDEVFRPVLLDYDKKFRRVLVEDKELALAEEDKEELRYFLLHLHNHGRRKNVSPVALLKSKKFFFLGGKELWPTCLDDAELRQDTQPLPPPLFEHLRHLLQARFPVLYAQVLEPTLADLRQEHSEALAEGHSLKARRILLQGCGVLAATVALQLGCSLLDRVAAFWQTRRPK